MQEERFDGVGSASDSEEDDEEARLRAEKMQLNIEKKRQEQLKKLGAWKVR